MIARNIVGLFKYNNNNNNNNNNNWSPEIVLFLFETSGNNNLWWPNTILLFLFTRQHKLMQAKTRVVVIKQMKQNQFQADYNMSVPT